MAGFEYHAAKLLSERYRHLARYHRGATHVFRLSDSPKTVDRIPTAGRPFPTRDHLLELELELESTLHCSVGLRRKWATRFLADKQSSDLLYRTLTLPIQRIEASEN